MIKSKKVIFRLTPLCIQNSFKMMMAENDDCDDDDNNENGMGC